MPQTHRGFPTSTRGGEIWRLCAWTTPRRWRKRTPRPPTLHHCRRCKLSRQGNKTKGESSCRWVSSTNKRGERREEKSDTFAGKWGKHDSEIFQMVNGDIVFRRAAFFDFWGFNNLILKKFCAGSSPDLPPAIWLKRAT